jgi:hypothetical protein
MHYLAVILSFVVNHHHQHHPKNHHSSFLRLNMKSSFETPPPDSNQTTKAAITTTTPSPTCVRSFPRVDEHDDNDDESPYDESPSIVMSTNTNANNSTMTTPTKPSRKEAATPQTRLFRVRECRTLLLQLPLHVGHLCQAILVDDSSSLEPMAQLICGLLQLAHVSNIDLRQAMHHKMALNRKKYPVEICKVRIFYTTIASCLGNNSSITHPTSVCCFTTLGQGWKVHGIQFRNRHYQNTRAVALNCKFG